MPYVRIWAVPFTMQLEKTISDCIHFNLMCNRYRDETPAFFVLD
jgi:hypothetical protein